MRSLIVLGFASALCCCQQTGSLYQFDGLEKYDVEGLVTEEFTRVGVYSDGNVDILGFALQLKDKASGAHDGRRGKIYEDNLPHGRCTYCSG